MTTDETCRGSDNTPETVRSAIQRAAESLVIVNMDGVLPANVFLHLQAAKDKLDSAMAAVDAWQECDDGCDYESDDPKSMGWVGRDGLS